jgi:transposase InsO family protein
MSPREKRSLASSWSERYLRAGREGKGTILTEFCALTGMHRKAAIRRLRHPPVPGKVVRQARRRIYGPQAIRALSAIWQAAGRPWSVRLKAVLPLWLGAARKRLGLSETVERQLLAMSPRTMDRCLAKQRQQAGKRLFGRTKPGTLLRRQIPIQTAAWQSGEPGYFEIDLVSHSGPDAAGEFLYSLNVTDLESAWSESRAVMGKGETQVLRALDEIAKQLPFPFKGIDSDNGSEFINHHLLRYCKKHGIAFTRSRPYKKDDNAHIEQKNWTHVRRVLGWDRFDSLEALDAIQQLYRNELRCMMNLFQPCVRLTEKQRIGARLRRRYDSPKTPLDRLLESGKGNRQRLDELVRLRERTDPFALAHRLSEMLLAIDRLATSPRANKLSASRAA